MYYLNRFISEIEAHTGENFDINNKRHRSHLDGKIKRLHSDELRKLKLIEKVLNSNETEDCLYNSKAQYTQKRFNN